MVKHQLSSWSNVISPRQKMVWNSSKTRTLRCSTRSWMMECQPTHSGHFNGDLWSHRPLPGRSQRLARRAEAGGGLDFFWWQKELGISEYLEFSIMFYWFLVSNNSTLTISLFNFSRKVACSFFLEWLSHNVGAKRTRADPWQESNGPRMYYQAPGAHWVNISQSKSWFTCGSIQFLGSPK
jgi:hypothetical protein